jgi:hypothetical protein
LTWCADYESHEGMTPDQIITALGGRDKTADFLGTTPKAVYMWARCGIPYRHHLAITRRLARRISRPVLAVALTWRPMKEKRAKLAKGKPQ